MKRLLSAFLTLALPIVAAAAEKTHMAVPGDQDCSECHAAQEKDWFEGKHGMMNVKCVVCHGSPEENFTVRPAAARCRGCHAEQVEHVASKGTKTPKACFACHNNHSLAVKAELKAPFHAKGGR